MNSLVSEVAVRVVWAHHHLWQAGHRIEGLLARETTLWYVLKGAVELREDEELSRIEPGTALLRAGGCTFTVATPQGAEWLSVGIRPTLLGHFDLAASLSLPSGWRPSPDEGVLLQTLIYALIAELHRRSDYPRVDAHTHRHYTNLPGQLSTSGQLICDGLVRSIFALCWRRLGGPEIEDAARHNSEPWLLSALRHLRHCPQTSVEEMAQVAGFSAAQFRRLFRRHTGLSPQEYLARHRLQQARHLIESSGMPISSVAAQLGFRSTSHFAALFKAETGLAPAEYRQRGSLPQV